MRITSFNLYNYCHPDTCYYSPNNFYSNTAWKEKNTWIKEQICMVKPNIIFFQEVFSVDPLCELMNDLGFPFHYRNESASYQINKPSIYTRPINLTVCDFPAQMLLPEEIHGFRRTPVLIADENNNVFGNFHLKSKRVEEIDESQYQETIALFPEARKPMDLKMKYNFLSRLKEFASLQRIVQSYQKENLYIGGDFNESNGNFLIQSLSNASSLETTLKSSPFNLDNLPQDPSLSLYNLFAKTAYESQATVDYGEKDTFDFLFSNKKNSLVDGGVLNSHFQGEAYYMKRSDHAPIWAEIKVESKGKRS